MNSLRPSRSFDLQPSAVARRLRMAWLLSAFCLLPSVVAQASGTPQVSLIYQWDFNGDGTGTTVTPAVYPKLSPSDPATGVLTMSQIPLQDDFPGDPTVANLYSPPGSGVFYNSTTNPNDRAFSNAGAIYDIGNTDADDGYSGLVSSNNGSVFTPPSNSNLSATAGTHTKITITGWVKLDPGALGGAQSRQPPLIAFGVPSTGTGGAPYSGQVGSNITGTYLGFFNDGGTHADTLQFTSNGAGGTDNAHGFLGAANIVDATSPTTGQPFSANWMFVAVTEDSSVTSGTGTAAGVNMYIGDQGTTLGPAVSSGLMPVSSSVPPASPGTANLNNNSVYIANVSGSMNKGLGALVDDVRIYDGALDQFQLDRVRQNLPIPVPGDFNLDGVVTVADVSAMMNAMSDLSDFQANNHMSAADLLSLGDLNNDNTVTNADIQSLICNLANAAPGQGTITAVPEPAAWLLTLVGFSGVAALRRTKHSIFSAAC